MRKLKINKDLSDVKLTRRSVKNARDRLAKQMAFLSHLTEAHWAGVNTCQECNQEYDFSLSKDDRELLKLIWQKTLSDAKEEDLESMTEKPKSRKEIIEGISELLVSKNDLVDVIKSHPDKARECFKLLGEYLQDDKLKAVG